MNVNKQKKKAIKFIPYDADRHRDHVSHVTGPQECGREERCDGVREKIQSVN